MKKTVLALLILCAGGANAAPQEIHTVKEECRYTITGLALHQGQVGNDITHVAVNGVLRANEALSFDPDTNRPGLYEVRVRSRFGFGEQATNDLFYLLHHPKQLRPYRAYCDRESLNI